MPCSICLTDRYKCSSFIHKGMQIPCGHHICQRCLEQNSSSDGFRCQICLQMFYRNQIQKQNNSIKLRKNDNKNILFCLSCLQSFPLQNINDGKHVKHHIQSIQKCLIFIKEAAVEKLHKTLTIEQHILALTQPQQEQIELDKFKNLIVQIQTNFKNIRQIIQEKQKSLLQQVQKLQQQFSQQLQIRRNSYQQLYSQIHKIRQSLQQSIKDQKYQNQECFIIFQHKYEQKLFQRIKEVKKPQINIPKFITINAIEQYLNSNFFLHYHSNKIKQQQAKLATENKRVNLLCKINRKLNLL